MSFEEKHQVFRRDVLLYVEDDEGFVDLFQCALKQGSFDHKLICLPNGEEAIAYFKGEGKYADREQYPLPCVALVDLKMPRVNGFELLKWIRQESPFSFLPVIVLTVSEEMRDVNQAYKLGANSFLIKPPRSTDLKEILSNLDKYWFRHNVTLEWRKLR